MRLLFIGDIVGKPGRAAVRDYLPGLRERLRPDLVIANGENLAGGKGMNRRVAEQVLGHGIDLLTGGNHIWDNAKGRPFVAEDARVVRPLNLPGDPPGAGARIVERGGLRVGVISALGRVFMNPMVDCPLRAVDRQLAAWADEVDAVFVDFHAEATSEKQAMQWHLNGRAAVVVGTHTHVQTNDARVLDGGTAVITDAGMTGSFSGIIGLDRADGVRRFLVSPPPFADGAEGDEGLCGAVIDVDRAGRATAIDCIREGGPW